MQRDIRYKWKPIKGENPYLIIVVMQRQALTPSHHCFSAGTNLQEAPTSIMQATTCKEAPTPFSFLQAPTYSRLQPQSTTNDDYQVAT